MHAIHAACAVRMGSRSNSNCRASARLQEPELLVDQSNGTLAAAAKARAEEDVEQRMEAMLLEASG